MNQFRIDPDGLRAWAEQVRKSAEARARDLERRADELEVETVLVWPKRHGANEARAGK